MGKSERGDFIEYSIKIISLFDERKTWEVRKRYNDFLQLNEELRAYIKFEPPLLPKKLIRHDEHFLAERRRALELYLKIILNERVFHNASVFKFINLPDDPLSLNLINSSPPTGMFKFYRAKITDTQIIFDKNSTRMCTYYMIMIQAHTENFLKCLSSYQIIKRYNDFHTLHESLSLRYPKMNAELPPKIDMFGAFQTNVVKDERKIGLEKYLNEIFQLDGIEQSFGFRVFIEFEAKLSKSKSPSCFGGELIC